MYVKGTYANGLVIRVKTSDPSAIVLFVEVEISFDQSTSAGKYKFPDDMGLMFAALHDDYGPVVRMRVSKDWVVVVSELSDVETVLKTKEPNPFRDPLQLVLKYEQRRGKAFPVLPTRYVVRRVRPIRPSIKHSVVPRNRSTSLLLIN